MNWGEAVALQALARPIAEIQKKMEYANY